MDISAVESETRFIYHPIDHLISIYNLPLNKSNNLRLTDIRGRVSEVTVTAVDEANFRIYLPHLSAGIYQLSTTGKNNAVFRFMVNN